MTSISIGQVFSINGKVENFISLELFVKNANDK